MTESDKQKQVAMHTDFFDQTRIAMEHGFYLEAIFREYAAIEGRLESLLSVLGAPCNKSLPPEIRKDIKISHRIECAARIYKKSGNLGNTKLTPQYFRDLKAWTIKRNTYIHGLYKNEHEYDARSEACRNLADQGLQLARRLYNEVKRLRRYMKDHADLLDVSERLCFSGGCKVNAEKNKE